ncbi:MAG: hypothetical protein LBU11_12490 [Zoogloeaceae bacterium]|jgi:hypothetical protein|nr:hypothetical protein [Zoogloeaceae bacterium]
MKPKNTLVWSNPVKTWKTTPISAPSPRRPLPEDVPALLRETLGVCRPAFGQRDTNYAVDLLRRRPDSWQDTEGNVHVDRGGASLFLAHTDTVHHEDGTQNLFVDDEGRIVSDGTCLGADDGAGLYLLHRMLEAGVPGYYLFCRGEECGSPGSTFAAKHFDWRRIRRCVAFDRANQTNVITHQFGGRCCSDGFAQALADALNAHGLFYKPDETGIFTDSANFMDVIEECTNLSVGYQNQHTACETLDWRFLLRLADACCLLDWDALPVLRDREAEKGELQDLYKARRAPVLHDNADRSDEDFDWPQGKARQKFHSDTYDNPYDDPYETWPTYTEKEEEEEEENEERTPAKELTLADLRDKPMGELEAWVESVPASAVLEAMYGIYDEAWEEAWREGREYAKK